MDSGKKYMARWGYLAASIIVFIIELIIALYVHDRIIRPYIGDMLVVVLVYCFVRVFVPRGLKRLPLYVFLFAVCVEVLQYFRLAELLGLQGNAAARIILGSVFDWKDIAVTARDACLYKYLKFEGGPYERLSVENYHKRQ